jgi:hypothetical protein
MTLIFHLLAPTIRVDSRSQALASPLYDMIDQLKAPYPLKFIRDGFNLSNPDH